MVNKTRFCQDLFKKRRFIHNALLAGIGHNLKMRLNQINAQIIFCIEFLVSLFDSLIQGEKLKSQKDLLYGVTI